MPTGEMSDATTNHMHGVYEMTNLYEKIIEILESLPSEHEIWKDDNIEQLIDEMSRIKLEKEIK